MNAPRVSTIMHTTDNAVIGSAASREDTANRYNRKRNMGMPIECLTITHARAWALCTAFGILSSVSAAAQGLVAQDQSVSAERTPIAPTTIWIVAYPAEVYSFPAVAPVAPYSCYRIGRCSAYDLYRFRDRPNRLTRLAPAVPRETVAKVASIMFPSFAPATPEENIVAAYKAASQVRNEYRAVSRPIDDPHGTSANPSSITR